MSSSILAALVLSGVVGFDHLSEGSSPVTANVVAEQYAAVSQAKLRIAERRLKSLQTLLSLGHASQKEVLSAETAVRIAKAKHVADREFLDVASTVAAAKKQRLVSGSDAVLIKIPGLADANEPELLAVCNLLVPVTEQWAEIANGLPQPPTLRNRSAAWDELRQRLSSVSGGASPTIEQESTRLRHELAIAEEDLSSSVFQPVRISRAMKAMQLSGRVFNNEAQLSVYLDAKRQQISQAAESKSMEAIVQQLSSRLKETKAIEAVDPVFARESEVLEHRIGQLASRAAMMKNAVGGTQTHSVPVSYSPKHDLPPFVERPTAGQLEMAYEATRRRVDAAHRNTITLRKAFRNAESHAGRISELAVRDSFFASEARVAGFDSVIAQAAWKQSETDLAQRRAELEFVNAVRNCATQPDQNLEVNWVTPLLQIFELRANTQTTERRIEATIAKYSNSYDAFVKLNRLGYASWKETTGAKVRLVDARDQLVRMQLQGKTYRQICDCLKSNEGLNAPSVALVE